MDINEERIKEEVTSILNVLKSFLPKKNADFVPIKKKEKVVRLSDIHAEAKTVFPDCFLGAKVMVMRQIADKVKMVQEYNFAKQRLDSYRSFSQLLHKEMEAKSDDKVVINPSGSVTATYHTTVEDNCEIWLTSKIKDITSSETELTFEKDTHKSIGCFSMSMRDVDPSNIKLVTQMMYRFFPDFSVGTQIGLRPLCLPLVPEYSISARYEKPSFALTSTVAKTGFQVCVFKNLSPDLKLASIINEGCRGGPPTVSVAMHKSYEGGSELKIFVDSERCGGFTFQKDVVFYEPMNDDRVLRLIASTLIDRQRRVRLGFGFHLDF